jgi:hypothetical protein
MTPVRTWPERLHSDCAAARRQLGEPPGAAEVAAVADIVGIARIVHPRLTMLDALLRLAAAENQ